jgi:hypothetical protein
MMKILLRYAGLIFGGFALFCLLPDFSSLENTSIGEVRIGIAGIDLTSAQRESTNRALDAGWKIYLKELDDQRAKEIRLAGALFFMSVLSVIVAHKMKSSD